MNCGHCHTCNSKLEKQFDVEWCPVCQAIVRYTSHGNAPGRWDPDSPCKPVVMFAHRTFTEKEWNEHAAKHGGEMATAIEAAALKLSLAAQLEWLERTRCTVTFNDRIQEWTVQRRDQVVGCIARDSKLIPALAKAMEVLQ